MTDSQRAGRRWGHECPTCTGEHYWTQTKVNVYALACTINGAFLGWLWAHGAFS